MCLSRANILNTNLLSIPGERGPISISSLIARDVLKTNAPMAPSTIASNQSTNLQKCETCVAIIYYIMPYVYYKCICVYKSNVDDNTPNLLMNFIIIAALYC